MTPPPIQPIQRDATVTHAWSPDRILYTRCGLFAQLAINTPTHDPAAVTCPECRKMNELGITEQDIYETRPPKPEEANR